MSEVRANLGAGRVRAALRVLPDVLSGSAPDPTGIVAQVKGRLAEELLRLVRQRFEALSAGGVDETGRRWKALAPATLKRKLRKGEALILRSTGRLFASLAAEATNRGAAVTTSLPYAPRVHRERPLWPDPLPPSWRASLLRITAEGVRELAIALVRRAGG